MFDGFLTKCHLKKQRIYLTKRNQRQDQLVGCTMDKHINFLREQAASLRELAQRAPRIADALCRIADQLDANADELEDHRRGSPI